MTKLPESTTDPQVVEFLNLWGLKDPVYLDYTDIGEGYAPNFCHVSAKHVVAKQEVDVSTDGPYGNSPKTAST